MPNFRVGMLVEEGQKPIRNGGRQKGETVADGNQRHPAPWAGNEPVQLRAPGLLPRKTGGRIVRGTVNAGDKVLLRGRGGNRWEIINTARSRRRLWDVMLRKRTILPPGKSFLAERTSIYGKKF